MRILSLCTGYAGLDLAVEGVTGARTVAVSDIDKGASKILAHRFPTIPNLGDLKAIDWAAWAGTEILTAGYPCQPFSHAGKREGTDDPRHIFPFIADGIRIVGPRLVVLENVRGHLGLGFDVVLGTLADLGMHVRWVCVRASDVGAPHRRERLFIVATPDDTRRVGGHEAVQLDGHRTTPSHRAGVPDESDRGPRRARPGGGATADPDGLGHQRTRRARDGREGSADLGHPAADATGYAGWLGHGDGAPAADASCAAGGTQQGQRSGSSQAASTGSPGFTGGRDVLPRVDWGQYAPAINRWSTVLGRPAPAPTEPGAKGQPRLSPRFVEFMMGLPAGWVTDVPDLTRNEQLKALGNGVVPQQAAAALTFLLNAQEVAG